MEITEIAAWWGAIIATLVLLWDMYKWERSGPIINVSASPNMQPFGKIPNNQKVKNISQLKLQILVIKKPLLHI